jgi:hypothetical protein
MDKLITAVALVIARLVDTDYSLSVCTYSSWYVKLALPTVLSVQLLMWY